MTSDNSNPAAGYSSFGTYVRAPIGRQPPCRLDATADQRCRLVLLDKSGTEELVFDVPISEVEHARLEVGQLTVVVGGRTHHMTLATPTAAARLGMTTMASGAAAGTLAGAAVSGTAMARREKQVDPDALQWLRLFAAHGVDVEAPALWKPRARYLLRGVAILVTLVAVLGGVVGVATEGGWTAENQRTVLGLALMAALVWMVYGLATWLLRRNVARDTARRLGITSD